MPHSGAAISENPAGMSPPPLLEEKNSLEELINFGLWKAAQMPCFGLRLLLRWCGYSVWSFYGQSWRFVPEVGWVNLLLVVCFILLLQRHHTQCFS